MTNKPLIVFAAKEVHMVDWMVDQGIPLWTKEPGSKCCVRYICHASQICGVEQGFKYLMLPSFKTYMGLNKSRRQLAQMVREREGEALEPLAAANYVFQLMEKTK